MNGIEPLEPLLTALGWTLVHFIWQGALIALALAIVLAALRGRSADARYVACCGGMAAMGLAPVVTLVALIGSSAAPAIAPAQLLSAATATATLDRLAALLPDVTLAWVVGVCLFQARMLLHWTNAQRIKHRGLLAAPEPCRRSMRELCVKLGIRRPVRIFESTLARVPMLIGWLRPVILVPAGAVTGLSPQQMRAVLAHELAHVRRHDYLINLVQAVFESLLFYHPAVWWLSNRLRVEREYCCDDVAVKVGGNPLRYARALSYLDSLRGETYEPALASTGGILMNRIRRLVGLQSKPVSRVGGWMVPMAAAATLLTAVSAMGLAHPAADEEAQEHDVVFFGPHVETVYEVDVVSFGPQVETVYEFDVVHVLEAVDSPDTPMFRVLRDAGFSNEQLVTILKAMGPEPRVLRAVERAAKGRHIKARLHRIHDEIKQAVAAGKMTETEAKDHMKKAAAQLHFGDDDFAERRMVELHKKIQDQLAAGLITEEEAHQKLERARQGLHKKRRGARFGSDRDPEKILKAELARVQDKLDQAVAAGEMTPDEAAEHLELAQQKLRGRVMRRFDGHRKEVMEFFESRMKEVYEQIKQDIAAGIITEAEAEERIKAAKVELHEHIMAELKQRRPRFDKRHKKNEK